MLSLLLVYCKSRKHTVAVAPPVTVTEQLQGDEMKGIRESVSGNEVEQLSDGIKITFRSELLFASNSSVLTRDAVSSIRKLGQGIKNSKETYEILVDGHTDATGTSSYNLWLSQRRAASVKLCLTEAGVDASGIKISGHGDARPVAENNTPEGRAKNRRVEITIIERKGNDASKGM